MSGQQRTPRRAQTHNGSNGGGGSNGSSSTSSKPTRRVAAEAVPDLDVYREMLAESGATARSSPSPSSSARKRRRIDHEEPFPPSPLTPSPTKKPLLPARAVTLPITPTQRTASSLVVERTTRKSAGKEKERAVQTTSTVGKGDYTEDGDINNVDNEDDNDQEDSNSSGSSSDDESDSSVDWEDVDLTSAMPVYNPPEEPPKPKPAALEVILDEASSSKKPNGARGGRKVTSIDRKIRLEGHKLHLLCLLSHVHRRNKWCSDPEVIRILKEKYIIDRRIQALLFPRTDAYQLQRTTSFLNGLKEATKAFQRKFWVTQLGLTAAYWSDPSILRRLFPLKTGDPPLSKDEFIDAVRKFMGSRDLGAQIFCAMLRSVGVTARLVCSLQTLPVSFHTKGGPKVEDFQPERKFKKEYPIDLSSPDAPEIPYWRTRRKDAAGEGSSKGGGGGGLKNGRVQAKTQSPTTATPMGIPPPRINPKRESPYPVYWVEAWNVAGQKWICIDPLVTGTVGLFSKLEPPRSDTKNRMSYVVAFEDGGHVKDVTRRYAKAYNAKTRKLRVGATKGGEKWWGEVLGLYSRGYELDRDQVEDAELNNRELAEPMPKNISDFKGHPHFALKRHIHRNEIISPERPVGSISISNKPRSRKSRHRGPTSSSQTETIYRRIDVKPVRSSMQWYKLGREIIENEQPVKHIPKARGRGRREEEEVGGGGGLFGDSDEEGEDRDRDGVRLYLESQTRLYVPPPVVDGKVPRNAFGNIDVYVPSMVPRGGVHLPYKEASKAAKLLQIDYADAITSFDHKGRIATAVAKGVVVAEEYAPAVMVVVEGIVRDQEEVVEGKRAREVVRLWKRFLVGLRIRRRLEEEYGEGDGEGVGWGRARNEETGKGTGKGKGKGRMVDEAHEGGGFMVDDSEGEEERARKERMWNAAPISHSEAAHEGPISLSTLVGESEKVETVDGARRRGRSLRSRSVVEVEDDDDGGGGGGFIPEDDEDGADEAGAGGGGFIPDEHHDDNDDDDDDAGGGGFLPDSPPPPRAPPPPRPKPQTPSKSTPKRRATKPPPKTLDPTPTPTRRTLRSGKVIGEEPPLPPPPPPRPTTSTSTSRSKPSNNKKNITPTKQKAPPPPRRRTRRSRRELTSSSEEEEEDEEEEGDDEMDLDDDDDDDDELEEEGNMDNSQTEEQDASEAESDLSELSDSEFVDMEVSSPPPPPPPDQELEQGQEGNGEVNVEVEGEGEGEGEGEVPDSDGHGDGNGNTHHNNNNNNNNNNNTITIHHHHRATEDEKPPHAPTTTTTIPSVTTTPPPREKENDNSNSDDDEGHNGEASDSELIEGSDPEVDDEAMDWF